jgi:hypothetical protein
VSLVVHLSATFEMALRSCCSFSFSFNSPNYGPIDEGMTQRVLIFALCGFRPRSKLVEGMIEAHRGARMAQPMKPKLGVHYKNSKEKAYSYSFPSRFSPTVNL